MQGFNHWRRGLKHHQNSLDVTIKLPGCYGSRACTPQVKTQCNLVMVYDGAYHITPRETNNMYCPIVDLPRMGIVQ